MVKSGLDFFYFEIHRGPLEIPANLQGQFSLSGQIFHRQRYCKMKAGQHIKYDNTNASGLVQI